MVNFKNLSIRNKLILIQGVTALIAVLTCSTIFVINDINIYRNSSYANKYSIAEVVGVNAASSIQFLDKETASKMLANLGSNETILNAAILDKEGKVFAEYSRKPEEKFVFPNSQNDYEDGKFSGSKYLVRYTIRQNNEVVGAVVLRADLSSLSNILYTYLTAAGIVLIIGLGVALVISFFMQQVISNRILRLVSKIKEVTDTEDYSLRIQSAGNDEITELKKGFNSMMEHIEEMENSLLESNVGLEKRVKERTAELETANKELESFSYSVSHDMRAPLRTINGYSKIIEKKYSNAFDADGKEVLQTINYEATRMGKIIDDLLAFSRLGRQDVKKQSIDMNDLAAKSLSEVMKSEENAEKAKIIIDNLPSVSGDPSLMQQVFINLLSNAVKYSSLKDEPVIKISSYRENGSIVFSVKDNGAGFDMQYYNKLFGVFQRLHNQEQFKGTGIGLAIVQKIITRHGGRVWAESKLNEGTTFYFALPG